MATSMPSSSRSSRAKHCSKVSFGSRLPPGNSAVEHDRVSHSFPRALQVQLLEFVPFGRDDQRVAPFSHVVHVLNISDVGENGFGLVHRLGVVYAQDGAFLLQSVAQI